MTRAIFCLLVILCLCARPSLSVAQSDRLERFNNRWAQLTAQVPRDPVAAARALESLRQRNGLAFDLWADSTVDSTTYVLGDAPCGSVAAVFLRRLPVGVHALSVDFAIEADSVGHTLREWPMPLDTWVDGVQGEVLLVPYDVTNAAGAKITVDLAIRPSGAFTVVARSTQPAPQDEVPCPPIKVLAGSAYSVCQHFSDPRTRKVRLVGFQRPCT